MRTLSITVLVVATLAVCGCEKTIHEASRVRASLPTAIDPSPAIVPAVDGVPTA